MYVQSQGTPHKSTFKLATRNAHLQGYPPPPREPTLKVASLERREENMWVSSLVDTPTALGMILAVFSLVMEVTEVIGIWI